MHVDGKHSQRLHLSLGRGHLGVEIGIDAILCHERINMMVTLDVNSCIFSIIQTSQVTVSKGMRAVKQNSLNS